MKVTNTDRMNDEYFSNNITDYKTRPSICDLAKGIDIGDGLLFYGRYVIRTLKEDNGNSAGIYKTAEVSENNEMPDIYRPVNLVELADILFEDSGHAVQWAIKWITDFEDTIKKQVQKVSETGEADIFDPDSVIKYAKEMGLHDLEELIEENNAEYLVICGTKKSGERLMK